MNPDPTSRHRPTSPHATPPLETPSSDRESPFNLPPGPGFPTLVRLHLRALWTEFPVAWVVLGALAVLPPLVAGLRGGAPGATPDQVPEFVPLIGLLFLIHFLATGLAVIVAFLWPDAVWRNLPPGGRSLLDALPVSRRAHRMARIVAGLVLPLALALSVVATAVLLGRHSVMSLWVVAPRTDADAIRELAAATLSLTAAYFLGSALAIRFGRVVLSLFLLGGGAVLLAILAEMWGWDAAAWALQQWLFVGHWAPGRSLFLAISAEGSDLAPALLWCLAFLALCTVWAGRHDRR
jgi:hypothetical protein